MILYEIFTNHLVYLIPEFFLATILLILLLYGVFYKNINTTQKILMIKNLTTIIIYLLSFSLILIFNYETVSTTLLNGVLIITNFTQFVKIVLIFCTIICFWAQKEYILNQKITFFEKNILFLISLLALMLLVSSNHFITLYLAIELQSLSFYILTASQKQSVFSIEAALKYFILGSIASGFILFGSSIIYILTGSLNFSNLQLLLLNINFLKNIPFLIGLLYAITFIFAGIFFKIGAAPFHFWLPDVYEGAPNNVTTFFAIVPKISFLGLVIHLFFDSFYAISFFFVPFFFITSLLSMFIGALSSLKQKKIKRLLAYSSISHVGFILIGFAANTLNNIPYIIFYILIYINMSINLWCSYLGLIINKKPIKYITELTNLAKENKVLSLIIIINLFSLAGIPPLAGFFSKFFIFLTAIKMNHFNLIFFAVIISIISSFYYLKIIKIIFFEKLLKKKLFSKIQKQISFLLLLNTQFILFLFIKPSLLLVILNKIYLLLLI
jgi:NADH-quinone oxidoreductase subunit N